MTTTNGRGHQPTTSLMTAAVYCRVSTDRQAQEGVSLEVQRQACLNYAKSQGYATSSVYVDDESSYAPRQQYSQMLKDAVDCKFCTVLVYDYSRFGRDLSQTPPDIRKLEALGITVVSVTSPNASRLERNLQFVINDHYSYELGRKVKPAHIQRVQQGLWTSRPPIGYGLEPVGDTKGARRVPKKLTPDPEQAHKVTRLFQLCATGAYSLNALVREADAMKLITSRGKPIARSNIADLLRNPVYIGKVVYGRTSNSKFEKKGPRPQSEWVTAVGLHTPLTDAETFKRCGEIIARHQKNYGTLTGGKPLLTGVVYCGGCGSKMVGRSRWKKSGKYHTGPGRYFYVTYRCYRYEAYRDCPNDTYHGGRGLERFAKEQLMRLPITDAERRAAKSEVMRALNSQKGNLKGQLKALLDQKEGHLADLKALSWRLVRDEIPDALYAEMRQEKEAQLAALEKQLATIQTTDSQESNVDAVLAFLEHVDWNDFDDQAWKEALAALVSRIVVVSKGQYRIEWQPGVELLALN